MTSYPKIVKLDVGGSKYKTSLTTLQMYPNSYLGQLFSGKFESATNEDGEYFIDGNGDMFKYILDFLRRDKLMLPDDFTEYELLSGEADFYQIQPLTEQLHILKQEHDSKLLKTKKLLLVWNDDKFPILGGGYNVYTVLKAAYVENSGIFTQINISNHISVFEDINEYLMKEEYKCVKKVEQLQLPKLYSSLYTYGVTTVPKFDFGFGTDEPFYYRWDVWKKLVRGER